VILRTDLRPGDREEIVALHGVTYAREHGFDASFETYVAGPLEEFARRGSDRERIWIAEDAGRIVGCVAIVSGEAGSAQLRWFLVAPPARRLGLGRRLLDEAVAFARDRGYPEVVLWTVSALAAAARLYAAAGFTRVEAIPTRNWGVEVVEEKYALEFRPALPDGLVVAVCTRAAHGIGKTPLPSIELLAGLGARGDAHCGDRVRHRSRVARDPSQPNLRQVHLIAAELIEDLVARGFAVGPGRMGENHTTRGIALLELPAGARLGVGESAVLTITGLRNPCPQLDEIQPGLMEAVLRRDPDGTLHRLCGVMGVVEAGGRVRAGDPVRVTLPREPHAALQPV